MVEQQSLVVTVYQIARLKFVDDSPRHDAVQPITHLQTFWRNLLRTNSL
jgi:hypothetical protein